MPTIRRRPLDALLRLVALAPALAAVGVALGAALLFALHAQRAARLQALEAQADRVGETAAAALVDGDAGAARRALEALRVDPAAREATLVDAAGRVLAHWPAAPAAMATAASAPAAAGLDTSRPVQAGGRTVGTISLRGDDAVPGAPGAFAALPGAALLGLGAAALVALRLRDRLARPLAELAAGARAAA
ncbi:MAG: CHASE sensor domain-containing protein, partial [Burkholderiaceae bacterium]